MSCKQLASLSVFAVLLLALLVNVSFSAAASGEPVAKSTEGVTKSYFGYHPKPKDSYKKLVEDITEYGSTNAAEWARLWARIEALSQKLGQHKDKDYGGYNYRHYRQMADLVSEQKAAVEALQSDRLPVPMA